MLFLRSNALILVASSLAGLTSASPVLEARQSTPTSTVTPPAKYYLQSKIVPGYTGDVGTNKNNLNIISYHTGAGQGVAAGVLSIPSMWGYLNGSQQLFTYEGSIGPWPMRTSYGAYQSFNEITISIASSLPPTEGFFFNETGLQLQGNDGWLLCDWWYRAPQLFAMNAGYNVTIPKSCSQVYLIPVPFP